MKQPPGTAPETMAGTAALTRYLYFTAAFTGAAVMIIEILGAKMLAPYVGTSHFVWTAQIAVTLVALACGYYAGGKLVDNSQHLGRLYSAILIAAFHLLFTTAACEVVARRALAFSLPLATLMASATLFFVPLLLLAMTGPFLIRVLTSSVATLGGNVGRLTAISTAGSFVGTVLVGYVLIPRTPNPQTMGVLAGLLMLLSAGFWWGWKRQSAVAATVVVTIGLGLAAWTTTLQRAVSSRFIERFRGNSAFGLLQVLDVQHGDRRFFLNDYLVQNVYNFEQKKSSALFTYMLAGLARAYTTNLQDALCIGMGIGVVPMDFARSGIKVDVVEINPAVIPVARDFFDFEPGKVNITIGDGRHFLSQCCKKYDTVILDAFLGDSTPSHLMTREAFASMRRVLKPGGTLIINAFGTLQSGRDFLAASLDKTLKSVFACVRIHAGDEALFIVASDQPALAILHPQNVDEVSGALRDDVRLAYATIVQPQPEHGRILTDDFNPAEFFDAANRERMRRALAMSMTERE